MANITIYEIAREAGCSPSTVSRVINGYQYVSKETREKILRIARKNNYVPNETARSLVKQSSHLIGILLSDIRTTQHTDGIYYIEKELEKKGYASIICSTGTAGEAVTGYIETLRERNVEALILMGSTYSTDAVEKAVSRFTPDIPVVICNGILNGKNTYSIITDEDKGIRDAVTLLLNGGSKHIAFIYDNATPSNMRKLSGYRSALSEYGGEERIRAVSGDTAAMKENIRRFLLSSPDTDGIICSEDAIASVVLLVLSEMKIEVPGNTAVIGMNNSRFAEISIPPMTSIDNRLYEISITAARTVLMLLSGEDAPKKVLLFSSVTERDTTRKSTGTA